VKSFRPGDTRARDGRDIRAEQGVDCRLPDAVHHQGADFLIATLD
jgi:hypothetical protein